MSPTSRPRPPFYNNPTTTTTLPWGNHSGVKNRRTNPGETQAQESVKSREVKKSQECSRHRQHTPFCRPFSPCKSLPPLISPTPGNCSVPWRPPPRQHVLGPPVPIPPLSPRVARVENPVQTEGRIRPNKRESQGDGFVYIFFFSFWTRAQTPNSPSLPPPPPPFPLPYPPFHEAPRVLHLVSEVIVFCPAKYGHMTWRNYRYAGPFPSDQQDQARAGQSMLSDEKDG